MKRYEQILMLLEDGMTQSEISRELGISRQAVNSSLKDLQKEKEKDNRGRPRESGPIIQTIKSAPYDKVFWIDTKYVLSVREAARRLGVTVVCVKDGNFVKCVKLKGKE